MRVKSAVYAFGGTGLAGMIEASRLMTGQPMAGVGNELQALAAVVIRAGSLQATSSVSRPIGSKP